MKREERNLLNQLRKSVNQQTIVVEIPERFTHEARQAMHELLTVAKHMIATCIGWNDIRGEYCVRYVPQAGKINPQESMNADELLDLPRTDYTWNGYPKPTNTEPTEPTTTETKEAEPMKTTTTATSERTKKTRENQQKRLDHVRELLTVANSGSPAAPGARLELIMILCKAVSYHDSGKIEGLHSLDTACTNNEFCPRMQGADDPAVICVYCYTKSMWQAAIFAHHITGEILSGMELTPAEASMIMVPALRLRFNSDGELINHTHAVNLIRIATTHPATSCAIWTKRPGILNAAIKQEGKPANLICGVSSPMINTPFKERFSWCDFVFTVYTPTGMVQALARGEHECNGRKCMDCGFHCYTHHDTSAGPVYVAEALRKPKGVTTKDFPAVIAAIDAATLDK